MVTLMPNCKTHGQGSCKDVLDCLIDGKPSLFCQPNNIAILGSQITSFVYYSLVYSTAQYCVPL